MGVDFKEMCYNTSDLYHNFIYIKIQEGMAKNTYGTGCFMLYNVGQKVVHSNHGLLATVGYQFGEAAKPVYALE